MTFECIDPSTQLPRQLLRLASRRNRYGIYDQKLGRWRSVKGDIKKAIRKHVRGQACLGAIHGGESKTDSIAVDVDGSGHKGQRRDADAAAAVRELRKLLKGIGLEPPLVSTSRSGRGFHVRVLFETPIPTERAIVLVKWVKNQIRRPEIDKLYPSNGEGSILCLPWCGISGPARRALVAPGGGLFVDPDTLEPVEDQLQHLKWSLPVAEDSVAEILDYLLPQKAWPPAPESVADNLWKARSRLRACRIGLGDCTSSFDSDEYYEERLMFEAIGESLDGAIDALTDVAEASEMFTKKE